MSTPQPPAAPARTKKRFVFGFYSLGDIATTLIVKPLATIPVAAIWTLILSFFGYIYDDPKVALLLFFFMLFDWATGIIKSIRAKTFNSYTLQRMLLNIPLTFGLICLATQLATSMVIFRTLHIQDVLMNGFMVTYLVSVIENLHAIDNRIIPDKLYGNVKRILNIDTLLVSMLAKKTEEAAAENIAIPTNETPISTSVAAPEPVVADELPNQ